jgi:hypothetical protein
VGSIVFGLGWALMMDDDGARLEVIRVEECLAMVPLDCSHDVASNSFLGMLETWQALGIT